MLVEKTYRTLFNAPPSLLYLDDLRALEKLLIGQDLQYTLGIELSTKKSENVKITGFAEVNDNNIFPKKTNEMTVSYVARKENTNSLLDDIIGSVSLTFYHNYISVHINSDNDDWFIGRETKIREYFSSKNHQETLFLSIA